ncbi:hypothetical protein C1645_805593 [Glomus cerebriforme]|uniref:Uncharacterized protein n=1 Tax=Glomus cerebriforme TaxID=658196 RepID=A0A397SXK8_9GLOM|nr:hypothetical protein C1645_805593 [Glomus cerebriforme]
MLFIIIIQRHFALIQAQVAPHSIVLLSNVQVEQVNEQEESQSIVQAPLQELSKVRPEQSRLVVSKLQETVSSEQVPQVAVQERVPEQPEISRFKMAAETTAEKIKMIEVNRKKLGFILKEIIDERTLTSKGSVDI